MRVVGHKLYIEWSGERTRAESSSTGTCMCGEWEESGSTQAVVREEYRWHLKAMKKRVDQVRQALRETEDGDMDAFQARLKEIRRQPDGGV